MKQNQASESILQGAPKSAKHTIPSFQGQVVAPAKPHEEGGPSSSWLQLNWEGGNAE